ncbi:uncharacterized protein LOC132564745 [Ylistrum balloti]|uniref:uncharacterized protein LOC132564745 n=1 Tax=Ylistrum balloti TaxID=509963 RepID=UPI002905BBE4|nr:uncharacterized protein LOC132564745 [Ylistrum balloti]
MLKKQSFIPERYSEFNRVPISPPIEYEQHVLLETQSKNLPVCGKLCHMEKECRFFNFDIIQKKCSMFSLMHTTSTTFSAEMTPFFFNKGKYTSLGYRQIQHGRFMYKVNEVSMNQESASKECMQQRSWLIKIDSESAMLSLQNVIAGNVRLDQTVCSEYLVSGLYGLDDSALDASSSKPSGSVSERSHWNWVKTYYISYSIDGNTWTVVTSQNNQPKIFTGNYDRNTLVKSNLVPNITARYIRINPQSYNKHNCLRFDLSGCYKVEETERYSEFNRVPILPPIEYEQHVLLETQSKNLPACGKLCHMDKECRFFNFDMIQKKCNMFSSMHTTYTTFSAEMTPFFVNKGKYTSLGYRQIQQGRFMYKVNEVSMNQESASKECMQQRSWLIKIDSASDMLSLQNVITGNITLELGYSHLFVSGRYLSMKWQHKDGSTINSSLWSPGNPYPGQGHCVVMTPTGLVSANCLEKHFSVCGF